MEITPHMGLTLPTENEYYDVNTFNENNRKIDGIITKLEKKTDLTRTYTLTHSKSGAVHTLTGLPTTNGIYQCQFVATADYAEGDTFEGYTAKPNGEETILPDKAFVNGDIVSVTVDAEDKKLGFKLGGGGGSKLNIFAQPTPPTNFEGVWLETTDKFAKVQCATDVVEAGQFTFGNEYLDMPKTNSFFGCTVVGDKIYCIGGDTYGGYSAKVHIYNTQTNIWSEGGDLPVGLSSFGCVTIGDKIYCIGGITNDHAVNTVYIYNTQTNSWSQGNQVPVQLWRFGCVSIDEKIYCIGGQRQANPTVYNPMVYIYNTLTNIWSCGSDMTNACDQMGVVAKDKEIYCIGGYINGFGEIPFTQIYNIESNSWLQSSSDEIPFKRYGLSCVLDEDKIYCIGGYNSSKRYLGSVEVFNTLTRTWETFKSMPTTRYAFGCVKIKDKIYCVGGDSGVKVAMIEAFDIQSNEWSINADLRQAKEMSRSIAYRSNIYTFGGNVRLGASSGKTALVEIYKTETNEWAEGKAMPESGLSAFGCVEYQGKVYCLGGYDNSTRSSVVKVYDIETNTWSIGKSMPTPRGHFGCTRVGTKIYCISGYDSSSMVSVTSIYDVLTNTWSSGKDISIPSIAFGCVSVGTKIYCIGGQIPGGNNMSNAVRIYDTSTDTWATGKPIPTGRSGFGCVSVGTKIYCIGGNLLSNIVEIYDTSTDTWATGKPMLSATVLFDCVYDKLKVYCLGGSRSSVYTSQTQILNLEPTLFPENCLVLETPTTPDGKYYSQLVSSNKLLGSRLLSSFNNAWIYKDKTLKEYPAYYGDSKQWVKFKN